MAEPDADRSDVDGALVDAFSLVVAGSDGTVLAQLVDAALNGVAFLIGIAVKDRAVRLWSRG